jgi:hypothetical protein
MKRTCLECGKELRSNTELGTEIHNAVAEKGFIPNDIAFEANGVCGQACATAVADRDQNLCPHCHGPNDHGRDCQDALERTMQRYGLDG